MNKRTTYRNSIESLIGKTKITSSGCWEWTGYTNPDGYGWTSFNGTTLSTHRLSWKFHNGDIPKDLKVLHKCDNRPCINPDHLFLGTQADNVRDMDKKKRRVSLSGENNSQAKLTLKQVGSIKELCEQGVYAKYIAPRFGISMATVYHIKNGRIWHRGYDDKVNIIRGLE